MEQEQPHRRNRERLTPEQEAYAQAEIEIALQKLDERQPTIGTGTARVIAACLHGGYGTVLEHFAATGRLNPRAASEELRHVIDLDEGGRKLWADALGNYTNEILHPPLDRLPPEFTEPPFPEAFITPANGSQGEWVSLATPTHTLEWSLEKLDPEWKPHGDNQLQRNRNNWTIENIVGFHDLEISPRMNVMLLHNIAREIKRYGELYAAFVSEVGPLGASRARLIRSYIGSFDNMTEVVETYAHAHGILDPDSHPATNGEHRAFSVRLLERGLRELFMCHQGRTQVHVFAYPGRDPYL